MSTRSHSLNTRANFQRPDTVTWVGNCCGRHGSYIFYKAFRFHPSKPVPVTSSGSSALVRTRTRERRNTVGENEVVKSPVEKVAEVTDAPQADAVTEERILCLGEFFFVQCRPEDPVCVGELQLLWHDKHSGQDLSSTRLYYLPETTPAGRTTQHGEDEVLAVSEKVVMRTNDLASWVVQPHEWDYGSSLPNYKSSPLAKLKQPVPSCMQRYSQLRACVNMADVELEKQMLMVENLCPEHQDFVKLQFSENYEKLAGGSNPGLELQKSIANVEEQKPSIVCCTQCSTRQQKAQVMVLSLTSYCRHKAVMRRLEGSKLDWVGAAGSNRLLTSLGAYSSDNPKLRVVFCRDTFDYSQLFEHDLICEEFAPVFKGRPRKKAKKPSNHLSAKVLLKRSHAGEESCNGNNVENVDPNLEKIDDASRAQRRRIKRKNPQRSFYDEGFAPTTSLSRLKRSRRGQARTPTPVGAPPTEKNASSGTSKSEPSSPTEQGSEEVGRRRSKRRPRPRPSDLSIALRNSLLENHKIAEIDAKEAKRSQQRDSSASSASSGSDSSRSASPSDEVTLNESEKLPSPSGSSSSASSDSSDARYAQPFSDSTSPIDYSAVTPPDVGASKDLDLTSETNMYLRGLSEGHLPENKSEFLDLLYQFMRKRNTPIGRIPSLGFKKLDLWTFFKLSQEYGGYDMVTAKRLWKHVYDRMGGNPSCTSAATCTRKHFEKLLLPLELYLRQAVSRSKNEETTNGIKNEAPANLSTLNGRTFAGDVYFHNSGKISIPSSALDGQKTPKSAGSPTDLTTPPIATSTSVGVLPNTESKTIVTSSAPTSMMTNGFNLESLVNSVVRSHIMANHNKVSKPTSEPLQLHKVNKCDGNTDSHVELIDLTEASGKSPTAPLQPDPGGKVPAYSKPQTLYMPPKRPVFTRTHCPRISNVPPPFVPKSSAPKPEAPPKHIPNEKKRSIPAYVELSRIQKDQVLRDDNTLQKHPSSYNPSPPSPKKSRDSLLLNTSLPSNRPYHISNLVSINEKPLARHDRPTSKDYMKSTSSSEFHRFNAKTEISSSKVLGLSPQTRPSYPSNALHAARIPTSEHRDRLAPPEANRFSAKHTPIASETYRHLPTRSEPSQGLTILGNPLRYSEDRNHQKSYYRPAGMIASHRERQQQAKSATRSLPNGIMKDEKISLTLEEQHRIASQIRSSDGPPTETLPVKKDYSIGASQIKSSPMGAAQHPPKKGPPPRSLFSSPFSVDRLTSDNNKRPSISGASRVVHKDEARPQHSRPISSSSYATVPRYVDPQQLAYKLPLEKESYRPPPALSASESSRSDRLRWIPSSQSYNEMKQTLPSSVASSSADKPSASVNRRAVLDSLPPQLAALVRAQMPPDCNSAQLQAITQQMLKSLPSSFPTASSLPQTIPGLSLPTQPHVLPESLLRPQPSLLMRAPSEQQAALVSELSRAALLQPSLPADPQLLMQMYQAIAYAQLTANPGLVLQDHAALAMLGGARTAPKPPTHSTLLNQQARAPINLQQAPILVTRPQQRSTEAVPGIPYPYARR